MYAKLINNHKLMLLTDQAIVSGATLLTQFMVANGLGLKLYGYFSVVVLAQLFLLAIQQAGLTGIFQVVYPVASNVQKKELVSGNWTILMMLIAVLTILSIPAFAYYPHGLSIPDFIAAVLNVIFFLKQDFFRRVFITAMHNKTVLVTDIINNGLQVAGLVSLYLLHAYSFSLVLWVCALSYLPALVISYFLLRPSINTINAFSFFKNHFSESRWMTLSALLQWFAGNSYIMAAGWWLGAATLGVLRLGQYVFGLLNVLLQTVDSYIVPRASAIAQPAQVITYLKSVQRKMLLFLGVLLLFVMVFAHPIVQWMKQEQATEIVMIIYGLCIVYIVIIIAYPVRIALRVLKMGKTYFSGYIINAILGFSTAYLFIHLWQLKGVLGGLLLSQVVLLVYWVSILQKRYHVLWK